MNDNQGPDTPSGLILPTPGCQAEIKEEPVDEDATKPPETVVGDGDGEKSEDEDIHDDEEAMKELIAMQIEVRTSC